MKKNENEDSGNSDLAKKGAHWIPEKLEEWNPLQDENSFKDLATKKVESNPQLELNLQPSSCINQNVSESTEDSNIKSEGEIELESGPRDSVKNLSDKDNRTIGFYELFLEKIKDMTKDGALSKDELIAKFELKKTQLEDWLKKSVESGEVKKLTKPVRFKFSHSKD